MPLTTFAILSQRSCLQLIFLSFFYICISLDCFIGVPTIEFIWKNQTQTQNHSISVYLNASYSCTYLIHIRMSFLLIFLHGNDLQVQSHQTKTCINSQKYLQIDRRMTTGLSSSNNKSHYHSHVKIRFSTTLLQFQHNHNKSHHKEKINKLKQQVGTSQKYNKQ